ncbi:hypothetical protein [Pseudomonas luteola]|uniref:Uncharacterized protein n=1 Tax=Pseudomonas luteola TaxID=47886 RepID=A0ABS0MUT7_PSELU|nr:hypothetical protein [Pseudomonas luteola]MBH3440484.1 hypothetical protein [Pseudomonas luteola]
MSKSPGYKVRRLAALLQKSFPDRNGLPVRWDPEEIYPAQGAWRSNTMLDVWRWEAFAHYVGPDGKNQGTAYAVGSYATITELIKESRLKLCGDEVYGPVEATRLDEQYTAKPEVDHE